MNPGSILIVQTAFPGDVILTLPLAQVVHSRLPLSRIDIVVIPAAASVCEHHAALDGVIRYDKHGRDGGVMGFLRLVRKLKKERYDIALVPHRSLRSALLVRWAGIPVRIGFGTSAGRRLLTHTVKYTNDIHEIERNCMLASAIPGMGDPEPEPPDLYPLQSDLDVVDRFLEGCDFPPGAMMVAIAPGSVWNTKRWLPERFGALTARFTGIGHPVVCVGGREDRELCRSVVAEGKTGMAASAAGELTLLQSAELIRRCSILVSNDSAPVHLASAVGTPVVAIFGATAPEFGFTPYGDAHRIVEIRGLKCRPCAIHGGKTCPIGTFDCMNMIGVGQVFDEVLDLLREISMEGMEGEEE